MLYRHYSLARDAGPAPIPCHAWGPTVSPSLTIVVVHGLGDHGAALPYIRLAEALTPRGFRVMSYDQRRHGHTKGATTAPTRLRGLISDLACVVGHARQDNGEAPLVVAGLSMGALVAILACHEWPTLADGVVAASAPLGEVTASRFAMRAAAMLGAIVPRLRLNTGIDVTAITDHQEDLAAYLDDAMFQRTTTLGLAADLLEGVKSARRCVRQLQVPTLLLHGNRDPIAPWGDGLAEELAGERRTVMVFDEGYHNLFLDIRRTKVFEAMARWCAALGARPSADAAL